MLIGVYDLITSTKEYQKIAKMLQKTVAIILKDDKI